MNNQNNDIPAIAKTIGLYKQFYGFLGSFPKRDKYVLGTRIENYIIDLLENLLLASKQPKTCKLPTLLQADQKLGMLKIFIRLALEVKIIDDKKYLILQERLAEIGRMLGGWIKTVR
ncbi:MAG: diversity-generating retroelement protein Avd [Candidatus Magasanikbacteria bacterium]